MKAILVESGTKPSDEYKPLKQDDITVWAPEFLDFKDDTVKVDLGGMPWSRSLKLMP